MWLVPRPRPPVGNRFRLVPFRSPLLRESLLLSFPPGTEMVHFPGLPSPSYFIQMEMIQVYWIGFPHSEIHRSKLVCSSPWLIAACRVLHRLPAPRHPPYALSSLTINIILLGTWYCRYPSSLCQRSNPIFRWE